MKMLPQKNLMDITKEDEGLDASYALLEFNAEHLQLERVT